MSHLKFLESKGLSVRMKNGNLGISPQRLAILWMDYILKHKAEIIRELSKASKITKHHSTEQIISDLIARLLLSKTIEDIEVLKQEAAERLKEHQFYLDDFLHACQVARRTPTIRRSLAKETS